jgi:hypothetical protein
MIVPDVTDLASGSATRRPTCSLAFHVTSQKALDTPVLSAAPIANEWRRNARAIGRGVPELIFHGIRRTFARPLQILQMEESPRFQSNIGFAEVSCGHRTPNVYSRSMKAGSVLLLLAWIATGCASAPTPSLPRTDSDEFQIEATVLAMYNVISGPAGRHDWDRFKELFAPGARLIDTRIKDGVLTTTVRTPDEFATASQVYLADHGFFEHPVATRTVRFRDMAHVWSTYESRHASADEQPFARGINSIQLVRSGEQWRILTIQWEEEDAAHPLPPVPAAR